jgi:hypothetical protein
MLDLFKKDILVLAVRLFRWRKIEAAFIMRNCEST